MLCGVGVMRATSVGVGLLDTIVGWMVEVGLSSTGLGEGVGVCCGACGVYVGVAAPVLPPGAFGVDVAVTCPAPLVAVAVTVATPLAV